MRAKHTIEILTKNVALYSIACIMYLLMGYNLMYSDRNSFVGNYFGVVFSDRPETTRAPAKK